MSDGGGAASGPTPEQRSLALPFAAVSAIMLATTVWALWDEAVTRRPWKGHQDAFHALLKDRAVEDLRFAEEARSGAEAKAHEAELNDQIAAVDAEIAAAREAGEAADPAKIAPLQREIHDLKQQLAFRKSEADEAYYAWKHALHVGRPDSEVDAARGGYGTRMEAVRAVQAAIAEAEGALTKARGALVALESRRARVVAKLARLDRAVQGARRRAEAYGEAAPKVTQLVDGALGVVDRCPSCHAGVDRPELDDEQVPRLHRTHPDRDRLLGAHPVSRFGCTPCHGGQGTATQELHAHALGGELGLDPRRAGETLHEHYWPRPLRPSAARLPVAWDGGGDDPTAEVVVPYVESSCRGCHGRDVDLPGAPSLGRGLRLVESLGCHGCHLVPGYEDGARNVGPSLLGVASKAGAGWLQAWIADPAGFRPSTRMPAFWSDGAPGVAHDPAGAPIAPAVRDRESAALTAYLLANGDRVRSDATGYDPSAPVALGERLVKQAGCLGCHAIGPEEDALVARYRTEGFPEPPGPADPWGADTPVVPSDFGPSLTRIGSKVSVEWAYAWVRDPQAYWPATRMPSLRLTAREASAIANYLMTLKGPDDYPVPEVLTDPKPSDLAALVDEGARLVRKYGCYGCHDIAGFEDASRVGPDLAEYGVKEMALVDFGDFLPDPRHQTWDAYTYNKLTRPRVYAHSRFDPKMPQFRLGEQEVVDLLVVMKSLTPEAAAVPTDFRHEPTRREAAIRRGRRFVDASNCRGCHVVEGSGGFIRTRYTMEEQNTRVPPPLDGEGRRVRADWLFDFLGNVQPLRPWLDVRMPSFGLPADTIDGLAHYFAVLDGQPWPFEREPPPDMTPAQYAATHELFLKLECEKCHPTSPAAAAAMLKKEGGGLAPRLDLSPTRLRRRWLVDWLRDPQSLQPGTRMPAYFYSMGDLDPESWWEDVVDETAHAVPPPDVEDLVVYAAALERPEDLPEDQPFRVDEQELLGRAQQIYRFPAGAWQTFEVTALAWPPVVPEVLRVQPRRPAAAKEGGAEPAPEPPSLAAITLTTPEGATHEGVLRLRGRKGGQVLLRTVQEVLPDAEAKVAAIANYNMNFDRRDALLASAGVPPPAPSPAPGPSPAPPAPSGGE